MPSGWQSQLILANQVIVFGGNDGIFVYNGTPSFGNPPIFSISTASQDQYGNQITPGTVLDTGMPLLLYSPNPGLGNLILSLSPTAGTDIYGNIFPVGLQVTSFDGSSVDVIPNLAQSITQGSAVGLLQTALKGSTLDVNQVLPSLSGPFTYNTGAANQQVGYLLSTPLLTAGGMAAILTGPSDDGTLAAGITFCAVNLSGGNLNAVPMFEVQPNKLTHFAAPSQTVVVLTGSGNWNAPADVPATVLVECWAGGGGGAGSSAGGISGGGGGGEYAAEPAMSVTPSTNYAYAVGAAGTAGASGAGSGGTGGNTTFTGNAAATVTAHGGGGANGSLSSGGTGGTGSTNTTHHDGGAGGPGLSGGGGQQTQTFTSSGTWIVPAGITSVRATVMGGGGGGGNASPNSNSFGGGAGGGAGCASHGSLAVTPGTHMTVTVGAGGVSGGSSGQGGNSTFSTLTGNGGNNGDTSVDGFGGAGGTGSGSGGGFSNHSGGTGSDATVGGGANHQCGGGGGGGGAGATGNGIGGGGPTQTTGGHGHGGGSGDISATAGGSGGNGGNSTGATNGAAGVFPGGGGGGSGVSDAGGGSGGRGAGGQVYLAWSAPARLGGGGGGTGGTSTAGNVGGTPTGAIAVAGGYPGGTGGTGAAGNPPASGFGGGGGGASGNGSTGFAGGAGKVGTIKITYTSTTANTKSYTITLSGTGYPVVTPSVDSNIYSIATLRQKSTALATVSSTTFASIAGLSFTGLPSGLYYIHGFLLCTCTAVTTNPRLSLRINTPGGLGSIITCVGLWSQGPGTSPAIAAVLTNAATGNAILFSGSVIGTLNGQQLLTFDAVFNLSASAQGAITLDAALVAATVGTFTIAAGAAAWEVSPV